MSRLGFVLLTHNEGEQLRRLAHRLVSAFDGATIACHHDFGQTPLDATALPSQLHFVRPHFATKWGDFSLVDAMLAGLRLLYEVDDPEYVVLLSGSDYPLKTGRQVLTELHAIGADAFAELHLVDPYLTPDGPAGARWPHKRVETLRRYFRVVWRLPLPLTGGRSLQITSQNRALTSWLAPYSADFRCWAGPQWMTLGRRAVHRVLEWHERNRWLEAYLRNRPVSVADESYIHSILGNAQDLRVDPRTFRFYEWRQGWWHPRELSVKEWPQLSQSGAHFVRKIPPNSPLLDLLDERLDKSLR
jgi:hypothetical protein